MSDSEKLKNTSQPAPSSPTSKEKSGGSRKDIITALTIFAVIAYFYGLDSLGLKLSNMSADSFSTFVVYLLVPFGVLPMIGHSILKSYEPVAAAIVATIILIIYAIWLYIFIVPDNDNPSKKEVSNNAAGAWVICQEFVERKLTSPSTADYPWDYRDKVEVVGTNTYLVTSYVDSQNGFGATVRSTFSCKVKQDGDSWELITLAVR